jgi:hypothetical protein
MSSMHASNPFALLMTPEVVLQAVRSSRHLEELNSRVCRPLDKPHFGQPGAQADDSQDDDLGPDVTHN